MHSLGGEGVRDAAVEGHQRLEARTVSAMTLVQEVASYSRSHRFTVWFIDESNERLVYVAILWRHHYRCVYTWDVSLALATASANGIMAVRVDDDRTWPQVTDEASLPASLAIAYGNMWKWRNGDRIHVWLIFAFI